MQGWNENSHQQKYVLVKGSQDYRCSPLQQQGRMALQCAMNFFHISGEYVAIQ